MHAVFIYGIAVVVGWISYRNRLNIKKKGEKDIQFSPYTLSHSIFLPDVV